MMYRYYNSPSVKCNGIYRVTDIRVIQIFIYFIVWRWWGESGFLFKTGNATIPSIQRLFSSTAWFDLGRNLYCSWAEDNYAITHRMYDRGHQVPSFYLLYLQFAISCRVCKCVYFYAKAIFESVWPAESPNKGHDAHVRTFKTSISLLLNVN